MLVLHGFTAKPKTVWPLVPFLEHAGFAFEVPVLRGHATAPEDLAGVRWEDWLEDALAAYDRLAAEHAAVAVVGHSMGGCVAGLVAARRSATAALVLAAPALRFRNRQAALAPYLWRIRRYAGEPGSAVLDPALRERADRAEITYPRFPVRAFAELYELSRLAPRALRAVRAPALVVHARRDRVIPFAASELALRSLGSAEKELRAFEGCDHELFWDAEADAISAQIASFLEKHSRVRSGAPA